MNVKNLSFEKIDRSGRFRWEHDGRSYCTNKYGEGIWQILDSGDWKQLAGTCDFVLSGYSLSGARKKLNRWFN